MLEFVIFALANTINSGVTRPAQPGPMMVSKILLPKSHLDTAAARSIGTNNNKIQPVSASE